MLIGLPASGKSALAKQLVTQQPKSEIISTDTIRAQLFGNESSQGSWLLVWNQVKRQFSDAVAQIRREQILNAIYDATNVVRRKRKEAIYLARTRGFTQITGIWLDTPLQVCLERNQTRDRIVPEDVILQMDRHLQAAPPNLEDGLDQLIYCISPISTEIALSLKRKNRTESS